MKRSPIERKTPMKPGAKPLRAKAPMAASKKTPARKATMKAKRPKMTPIRASARGKECALRFPGICNGNPETTVWCHSNRAEDGKGMGLKARDEEGCYGCSSCHAWLDGGYAGKMARSTVDAFFDLARGFSHKILRELGLLK